MDQLHPRKARKLIHRENFYVYGIYMNNHIYSTLFKIQERKSDRRSREIEQRKESQNTHTHKTRTCELNLLH